MQQEPGVRKWEGYPWNHGESHRDSEIVGETQRISQKGEDVHGRKDNEARGEAGGMEREGTSLPIQRNDSQRMV